MNQMKTRTKVAILAAALFTAAFITGCASYKAAQHKYVMRGTILQTAGNEVYLCIGSKDGAQAGQKFDVYKLVAQGANQPGKGGVPGPTFRKEKTGAVKITQIVDEHFARAAIVSGAAQKDYIVELEFPANCD